MKPKRNTFEEFNANHYHKAFKEINGRWAGGVKLYPPPTEPITHTIGRRLEDPLEDIIWALKNRLSDQLFNTIFKEKMEKEIPWAKWINDIR